MMSVDLSPAPYKKDQGVSVGFPQDKHSPFRQEYNQSDYIEVV